MESNLVGYPALISLQLAGWLFYLLPESFRKAWAWALARILEAFSVRAPVIEQNLKIAFPAITQAELRARRRAAYEHLSRLALEILMVFGPMPRFARERSELRGQEIIERARARKNGVILISSHVGNWEVMAATTQSLGLSLLFVTKRLKPAWLHRAMEKARLRSRVRGTYEPRTLRDVLRELKGNGIVGFVLDQYAGAPVGVRVPVFGVPVGTTTAIAALARRTGAAVLPVVNHRLADGSFVVEVREEIAWESLEAEGTPYELAANTAQYARAIERDIYAHPEQWLWTHRRFKGDLSPLLPDEWRGHRSRK